MEGITKSVRFESRPPAKERQTTACEPTDRGILYMW